MRSDLGRAQTLTETLQDEVRVELDVDFGALCDRFEVGQ
jgi:hypothetical protein